MSEVISANPLDLAGSASAIACHDCAGQHRLVTMVRTRLVAQLRSCITMKAVTGLRPAQAVDPHGRNDYRPLGDRLPGGSDPHDAEAIVEDADDQRPEKDAKDRSPPSGKADPADGDCGNRGELEARRLGHCR